MIFKIFDLIFNTSLTKPILFLWFISPKSAIPNIQSRWKTYTSTCNSVLYALCIWMRPCWHSKWFDLVLTQLTAPYPTWTIQWPNPIAHRELISGWRFLHGLQACKASLHNFFTSCFFILISRYCCPQNNIYNYHIKMCQDSGIESGSA